MENEILSVVIPMYNAEKYVSCMIKSIIYQSFKNFRVYIIDDHSTDNSMVVTHELVKSDSRFSVISRPLICPRAHKVAVIMVRNVQMANTLFIWMLTIG